MTAGEQVSPNRHPMRLAIRSAHTMVTLVKRGQHKGLPEEEEDSVRALGGGRFAGAPMRS